MSEVVRGAADRCRCKVLIANIEERIVVNKGK